MITVEEAKQLLLDEQLMGKTVSRNISEATGFVLAADVFCTMDLPSFDNSSMDGYAVAIDENNPTQIFKLIGEIKAGANIEYTLQTGQAVRIFTGAAIPQTANAIVIQENVVVEDNHIHVNGNIKLGAYIRRKGSMIQQGELALEKGHVLNAASIGFIASLGITYVDAISKPKVSILVTGDEIIKPGNPLLAGQIYESNSYTLQAALQQMNIEVVNMLHATDDETALRSQLNKCLQESDVILLTGGISVGKYDLVYSMMQEFNIQTIFYKIAQKPGKPFYAGKRNNQFIFALPGNPASVLVCFYEYVFGFLRKFSGIENPNLVKTTLPVLKEIKNNEERAQFLRAKIVEEGVMPLEGQDSFMLLSFAYSNAIIYLPKGTTEIKQNDLVEVHLLPV
jgi:molybdopterin molybdotransferase